MNKKTSGGMNIGTSSILVTFVLLCLVTFAALTYMSAQSDLRLSRQAAQRTTAYYDANRMGEIYLANIESLLVKLANSSEDEQGYMAGIPALFHDNNQIVVQNENGAIMISFLINVGDAQNLSVQLQALYPDTNDGKVFDIVKWNTQVDSEYINELKQNDTKENSPKLMF